MEYLPTKEQEEALSIVLGLLDKAIEESIVPCGNCKHYKETDHEYLAGRCLFSGCNTYAENDCEFGEKAGDTT